MLYCLKCKGLSDTKRVESRPDSQGMMKVESKCTRCGSVLAMFTRPTRRLVPEAGSE